MAQTARTSTNQVLRILSSPTGLPFSVAAIAQRDQVSLPEIGSQQVLGHNIAFEVAERSTGVYYPKVYVYCDKVTNLLREKFRTFSGKAHMVVEVRVSQDRIEGLENQLQAYAEAVTDVLDSHRGSWGNGAFYTGGYEVSFGGVKHGGKNFLQVAKVTFDVEMSTN